jgi:two-component system, LytTR family, response regulator LytT
MRASKHIIFWILVYVLLTVGFGSGYGDYSKSLYFVTFLLPVAMATSYFFNYVLVPRYLLTRKYSKFVWYTFYTLVVSAYLEMLVVTASFIVIANYNIRELDPLMNNIFVLCFAVYVIVLVKAFVILYKRLLNHEFVVDRLQEENESLKMESITVRVDRSNQQIKLDELKYVESLDDYVALYVGGDRLLTRENISTLAKILPEYFIRIHRSYLVNRHFVTRYNTTSVVVGGQELPLSRTYKESAMNGLSA